MTEQCKHAIKDNKGILNCTKNDSTIGYCQQPCPYKATASASMQSVTTSAEKLVSRRFRRKQLGKSSFTPIFESSDTCTVAVEGDVYEACC
jgi:hypothetical protein